MSALCNRCSRPHTERRAGLVLALVVLMTMTTSAQDAPTPNGIRPCEESSACIVESREFELSSDVLFSAAIRAIDRIAPASIEIAPDRTRLSAEFRVFLFRDDVDVVVERDDEDVSRLHIRSASRTGRWDAGVNARRVRSFFRHLDRVLAELNAQR